MISTLGERGAGARAVLFSRSSATEETTSGTIPYSTPYVVIGNAGYHNFHRLAPGSNPGEQLVPGVTFEYGDDSEYGFLKLTVNSGKISGEYVGVTPGVTSNAPPQVTPGKDTF